ncbi:transposase [Malaciobacter marinus]|jgi:transposase|uniref:Transposase n=1 Tax=Malaciobacter marinus TaxID=505249 RepID=A0AB36ZT59_9BACT|nr:IS110 family transposase [Malaciobacter marinus]PPK57980.1 transposase [Malaciobacter marinus]SKB35339.1 Transposase [Malaciobacter marinus]
MYYVGVDIAKDKHYVCILDESKELACKPFWIHSDILGLRELLKRLADLSLDNDDFIIGIESTGAFSENFYSYLTDANYKVILLNSYQTAKYRDFSTLKKIKNDSIDAYVIAELLATGKYKASYISNEAYHNLKVLNRLKKSLDDKIKTIKREISTVVATVNPEIEKVFPNIFTKTAIAIIKAYPTAMDIQKATPAKLTKIFRHIKGNNFSLEKAKYLIELAYSSIYSGRAYESRALMIRTNIKILELYIQEKEDIEKQIQDLIDNQLDEDSSNIENTKSIPGVANKTIAAILGECGDLRRFESAKAFIGFLGLYPTLYQSGKSLSTGTLAKRGIPIAKHALYLAAVSAVRHNTELHKLYRDKRSSGKSTKEALIIVAKKLASIIYSLFKYNQAYNPNRVLIQHRR